MDLRPYPRALSVGLDRVGDVRVARGDLAGALDAYTRSLEIAERLAAADPDNTDTSAAYGSVRAGWHLLRVPG